MKTTFIFCLLLFIVLTFSFAGENPNRTAVLEKLRKHYEERLTAFTKENQELKTVVFLGDSLTEGFDLQKYFPANRCVNRGIVADHVGVQNKPGILQRLDVSVFDCNPSRVFLLIGVNDLADEDHLLDEVIKGYEDIIVKIKTTMPSVVLHVQSCLPCRDKYQRLNAPVIQFNERIKVLAEKHGCPYVDLHPLFLDEKGELRDDLTRDGIHLNDQGYEIWAHAIRQILQPVQTMPPERGR